MHLRQSEAFSMFNYHDRRVRHVDADFDDSGRDERVEVAALELLHDNLFFVRWKPAMQKTKSQAMQRAMP